MEFNIDTGMEPFLVYLKKYTSVIEKLPCKCKTISEVYSKRSITKSDAVKKKLNDWIDACYESKFAFRHFGEDALNNAFKNIFKNIQKLPEDDIVLKVYMFDFETGSVHIKLESFDNYLGGWKNYNMIQCWELRFDNLLEDHKKYINSLGIPAIVSVLVDKHILQKQASDKKWKDYDTKNHSELFNKWVKTLSEETNRLRYNSISFKNFTFPYDGSYTEQEEAINAIVKYCQELSRIQAHSRPEVRNYMSREDRELREYREARDAAYSEYYREMRRINEENESIRKAYE